MNADSDTQLPMHNSEAISRLLDICEALNRRISLLEARVDEARRQSKRDGQIASMLANGIQPD